MKKIELRADFPGCGKSYTLCVAYAKFPSKRKYYITPQNKQKQDVISLLKTMGCNSPKVKTIDEFLGNWKRINHNGETRFIKTDQVSDRAKTKRQIDLFIDEFSSVSAKTLQIITDNFNIRNMIVAGDSHQFDPIPFKSEVYQVGSNTKKEYTYEDDGSLPNMKFDKTYVLTKPMRAKSDTSLRTFLKVIKNADAAYITNVINELQWKGDMNADDLHIAYTNKVVDKINKSYAKANFAKQFITRENDKAFGLMKGRLLNEAEYKKVLADKKAFFVDLQNQNKIQDAEEQLAAWETRMFGYASAVTSHKLQGTTVRDRNIIIHLEDLYKFVSEPYKNKALDEAEQLAEYLKRVKIFHKFLYVAVSRATKLSQIRFCSKMNVDFCSLLEPFVDDVNSENIVKTTSEDFNIDELFDSCDLIDAKTSNKDIAEDALNLTYKQFAAKYDLSIGTWKRLRAVAKATENKDDKVGIKTSVYKGSGSDPYFNKKPNNLSLFIPKAAASSCEDISKVQIYIKGAKNGQAEAI